MNDRTKGLVALTGANLIWGLSPLYWKLLAEVPAMVVLGHRSFWSLAVFGGYLVLRGRGREVAALLGPGRFVRTLFAAVMISINWGLFIWAVQVGRTVDASLGYYIFPLVAVLFGWLFFREAMGPAKLAAMALAAVAVTTLGIGLGAAPWISLVLALSFASYGVIKKGLDASPIVSVTGEIVLLTPVIFAWVLWREPAAAWPEAWMTRALLAASGVVSLTPLMLFTYGARRLTLATVGLMQYLNPTLQFAVAALVFAETVTRWHWIAFPLIWLAVTVYSLDALRQDRAARRRAASAGTSSTSSM